MIQGGKGGANTQTGLKFEKRTDLREVFKKVKGYSIRGDDLLFNERVVAKFLKKSKLYKFLKGQGINWETRLSKRLLPDEAIFVLENKTLFVVEMKFQKVAGSVDEKLQTCDFKKKTYQKLFSGTAVRIEYCYILSNWFEHKSYEDTLKYINSVGCKYFFGTLPFEYLGLPK